MQTLQYPATTDHSTCSRPTSPVQIEDCVTLAAGSFASRDLVVAHSHSQCTSDRDSSDEWSSIFALFSRNRPLRKIIVVQSFAFSVRDSGVSFRQSFTHLRRAARLKCY